MPTIKSVPSFPIQIPLNHKTMEYSFRALPLQDILHQARQKDKLFLTKFARKNPDDSIVREFKIVPNPDSISYNDIYWIVRLTPDSTLISTTSVETTTNPQSVDNLSAKRKGKKRALDLDNNYSSSSTQQPQQAESSTSKKRKTRSQQQLQLSETTHDTSQQDSDHPLQLLECTVYGEISFLEAGSYGNWVPREADNVDNITFPKEDPQKATISITLKAIALVAESLRIIDEEMKAFLETSDKLDTYNYMVKKDHITIKYPLLVAREEVAKSQVPMPTSNNDPREWIEKYADGMLNHDAFYVSILKADNNEKGYVPITRKSLSRGDVIQAKVSFEPYHLKNRSTAGITLRLQELMVIRSAREVVALKSPEKKSGSLKPPIKSPRRQ